ncbi:hypothetical protein D9757_012649 [Collybiopsis confluens]|uniref:Uncharacterized protein n=1 Tax=Collybiopsis confluens TaxID=2823264 RepID=A0A8H5D3X3_9AGAR|nr:hypothetical protein D9757_012649 [Collybiopsis confluens]
MAMRALFLCAADDRRRFGKFEIGACASQLTVKLFGAFLENPQLQKEKTSKESLLAFWGYTQVDRFAQNLLRRVKVLDDWFCTQERCWSNRFLFHSSYLILHCCTVLTVFRAGLKPERRVVRLPLLHPHQGSISAMATLRVASDAPTLHHTVVSALSIAHTLTGPMRSPFSNGRITSRGDAAVGLPVDCVGIRLPVAPMTSAICTGTSVHQHDSFGKPMTTLIPRNREMRWRQWLGQLMKYCFVHEEYLGRRFRAREDPEEMARQTRVEVRTAYRAWEKVQARAAEEQKEAAEKKRKKAEAYPEKLRQEEVRRKTAEEERRKKATEAEAERMRKAEAKRRKEAARSVKDMKRQMKFVNEYKQSSASFDKRNSSESDRASFQILPWPVLIDRSALTPTLITWKSVE